MRYQLIVHSGEEELLYPRPVAARLARISLDFLRRCEREKVVQPRGLPGGGVGYTAADIRQLARVRRLTQSLGLDLRAVEVVLHLRRQVISLQAELEQIEGEMARRELAWQTEVQELRRQLAREIRWG